MRKIRTFQYYRRSCKDITEIKSKHDVHLKDHNITSIIIDGENMSGLIQKLKIELVHEDI